jgi:signal transduction histidine kinase/ActR/RegA family two-component response regulator
VRAKIQTFRHLIGAFFRPFRSTGPVFGAFQKAAIAKGRLVLTATFALTLASSISLGLFAYRNLDATREASRLEKHTYQVILELNSLLGSLKGAESGQRGFVITGNHRYLDPYHRALVTVKTHLANLHDLTKDNPNQLHRLASIERAALARLSLLDETLRLRTTMGFQSARDRVMTDAGKKTMDELSQLVDQAVDEEERLLRERTVVERRFSNRNFYFLLTGNLLGVVVLSTLYLFLWREFAQRIKNESDLMTNRDLLEMQNKELRRAGEERREMEALLGKYSDLYNLAPVGYFNLDSGGVIRAVNLTGARFLGGESSFLLGHNLDTFLLPDTRPIFHDFLHRVFSSQSNAACEVVFQREDIAPIFVQIEAVVSESKEDCRAVFVDISELKRAQEESSKLEEQLHQAQKMESVGRLAGGVAHDFNNMLSVIIGQANLALMDMDPSQPLHRTLEEILKAAERSADLTRQLLAFARRQTVAPKVLDLNQTVAGTLTMLKRIIGENVELNWQPGADLWPTRIDPSQIDQILANLCSNSRDSISKVGRISIETKNCTIDENYCAHNSGFLPGEYVQLSVSDDGSGMDKAVITHIFEPFFTTKGPGKGTGLGLATVFGAVKQNNGFINVYSEPGLGTTFTIYLPRHLEEAGAQAAVRQVVQQPPAQGRETILLVEDEPSVLNMASMLLTRQGYTVLAADTPSKALNLAREHAGEIALLMTDVVMPEMSGRELSEQLMLLHPRLKRLFMSGYTSDIIAHHGVIDEGVHFIQKPFTISDLATQVRKVLDSE